MEHVIKIAKAFIPTTNSKTIHVEPYGSGNINDTYLVRVGEPTHIEFILQRINQKVFPHPEWIMANMRVVTNHIQAKMENWSGRRWESPNIISTTDGQDYVIDANGDFWRAVTFITNARTYPTVKSIDHAREAGFALGTFHRLICDLEPGRLHDTLPGFHVMPSYLQHYDEVVQRYGADLESPEIRYGVECVAKHRTWALTLHKAYVAGLLQERPTHGDPKIDNIMIDDRTNQAIGIIDWDTVKPGLVQHDIGDCLRSCCNRLGEETDQLDQVSFDLDLCQAILQGYLPEVEAFYTPVDYAHLYDAIRTLAFEQALRFFTDHLEGDVYYKVKHHGHNLMRALVQFRLLESIESQGYQIRELIHSLTSTG